LQHEPQGQLLGVEALLRRRGRTLLLEPQDGTRLAAPIPNHAEAKADITDYIVGFYNCKRINSALRNLSPAVYERKMAAHEPIVVSEIT
jgi:transposase InsO family protein